MTPLAHLHPARLSPWLHTLWLCPRQDLPQTGHPRHRQRQHRSHQRGPLRSQGARHRHAAARPRQSLHRRQNRAAHRAGQLRSRRRRGRRGHSRPRLPVWLGFRGGKGVASALGVFLALTPACGARHLRRLPRRLCAQPLRLAGLDHRRRVCSPSSASTSCPSGRRSSSPASSSFRCSSSSNTTRTSAACSRARKIASAHARWQHEPHRHPRSRSLGHRPRALPRPSRRPRDRPLGPLRPARRAAQRYGRKSSLPPRLHPSRRHPGHLRPSRRHLRGRHPALRHPLAASSRSDQPHRPAAHPRPDRPQRHQRGSRRPPSCACPRSSPP